MNQSNTDGTVFISELQPNGIVLDKIDSDMFNHLNMSGRKKYYQQGYYGQDVIVAVIDSGCSVHTEFEDRLLTGINLCSTGYCSPTSHDDFGHGTHVSGIIAGKNCGIAPKAKILPVKVLDIFGNGGVPDVIKALKWCKDWKDTKGNRIDIINMSLSSRAEFFVNKPELLIEYHKTIQDVVNSGIAVIVAAGNTGKEQVLYPAFFEEVITVGAVDIEKKAAYFTTKSKQVDVSQIGVDVLSTYFTGNKYSIESGTSMASPHVAGIAALMVCKYKAMFKNSMPEPVIYEMLKMNTIDIGTPGTDIITGAGFCTLNPSMGKTKIQMKENDPNIIVNGKVIVSDAPPIVVSPGRFMAPVRFLVETIGGQASYNMAKKEATFEIEL